MEKINRLLTATAAACILAAVPAANAALNFNINASVGGGAIANSSKVNFDDLTVGNLAGIATTPSGNVAVAITLDGGIVASGASTYAMPVKSGNNDVDFNSTTLNYLTTGIYQDPIQGSVTLTFNSPQNYLGLLWGSVDNYNKLTFFNGSMELGFLMGDQLNLPSTFPYGNQGVNGTVYANIFTDQMFTKVVATSSQYAFEFDNIAVAAVPEPSTIIAGALLLLPFGASAFRSLRRNKA